MKGLYLLLPVTLLLFGCDSSDSQTETELCPYYVQKDLDNKNYDSAESRLKDPKCKEAYENYESLNNKENAVADENTHEIAKASLHAGKAGLSVIEITKAILPKDDEKVNFAAVIEKLGDAETPDAMNQANLARKSLKNYLDANNIDCKADDLNDSQKAVCLNDSLMGTAQATQGIRFMLDFDKDVVHEWAQSEGKNTDETDKEIPENMKYSVAAIEFAEKGTLDGADDRIKSFFSVADKGLINFDNQEKYKIISITNQSGKSRFFLEKNKEIIITKGFCKKDGVVDAKIEAADGISTYPCPSHVEGSKSISLNNMIVENVNNAIDRVVSLADSSPYNTDNKSDSDIAESMKTFKCQVNGKKEYSDSAPITMLEMTKYLMLNKQERKEQKNKCENL